MKKTALVSVTMAAVLLGGAYFLPVQAQEPSDPFTRVVTIEFDKANVRDALTKVAASMGIPIDIAPDVQGTVSLSLSHVTNMVLLTNLTRQVDATMTMRQGRLTIQRDPNAMKLTTLDPTTGMVTKKVRPVIDLRANQADVRETLRNIFRQSGISYSISPDVQGTVTADLQNVTFETALANVLRQVDATYLVEAGVFHIVRPDNRTVLPPQGSMPSEPPVVAQDSKYLYLISSGKIVKIRKSDLKVEQERSIPVQWGNQTPARGGF